ncbi:MAG TPA: 50S ribosomal protein L19 [Candidatus Babeliales bacterium]|jgi:large subunit ribosomal protein L19|nr:50S ribosomal protein L19 [Candidatus Babeliales bacterium]
MKAAFYTKETIRSIGMKNREFPEFGIGDMVIVSQSIKEAGKERLQAFQGNVISIRKCGASSTFIVRKIADNSIAVERIFPYFSPLIKEIKVVGKGDVRRAKLYYLRKRVGKAAQVKQLVETKASIEKRKLAQKEAVTPSE